MMGCRPEWTHAVDGDGPHGSALGVYCGLAARRVDDDGVGGALSDQSQDRSTSGWIAMTSYLAARAGRSVAGADGPWAGDGCPDPRRGPGAPADLSALGAEETTRAACGSDSRGPRGRPRARWATCYAAKGSSQPRRRARYLVPLTQPLAAAQAPNDVWTADFKGWFRTADQTRCDPLTVADAHSRFVLCCRIVAPSERGVRPWFERTFRDMGCRGRYGRTTARPLRPPARGACRTWRCGG